MDTCGQTASSLLVKLQLRVYLGTTGAGAGPALVWGNAGVLPDDPISWETNPLLPAS